MNHERISANYNNYDKDSTAALAAAEIVERFNRDRFIKVAPDFSEQLQEDDRTNPIVYISDSDRALHGGTSDSEYSQSREMIPEIEALRELDVFLSVVEQELPGEHADKARSIRENLTYIGEKEYKEASAGIASYWKAELSQNPSLQILAVAGEIAKKVGRENANLPIKSDEYLLENILANFSDAELEQYAGRLIVDGNDVTAAPEDVRVILLDDWTISGSQIDHAHLSFTKRYPELKDSIEVQLIAASESRITNGCGVYTGARTDKYLPVKAYYKAHSSGDDYDDNYGIHVTGSHSSVDFDFEEKLADMVKALQEKDIAATMPAPTNIVRPYRYDGITRESLMQRVRVTRLVQAGSE